MDMIGAIEMEPIVHFLLSVIAGLGIGLHMGNKNKKYLMIILMAILATALDLDHLFPGYAEGGLKIFHNIFIFINIPVILLLSLIIWERGKGTTQKQRNALLLCVMFPGHMFTDIISGAGVSLFYPFNTNTVTVGNIGLSVNSPLFSLQAYQVLLIFWGAVIVCANLAETFTYLDVEGRKLPRLEYEGRKTSQGKPRSWLPTFYTQEPYSQKAVFRGGIAMEYMPLSTLPIFEKPSISMQINEMYPPMVQFHDIPSGNIGFREFQHTMITGTEIPLTMKLNKEIPRNMIPTKEMSRTINHGDEDLQNRPPMVKNPPGLNSETEDITKYIFSFVELLSKKGD